MNGVILQTIEGLDDPNVAVADIQDAYTVQGKSHVWCSDDPWAYGLSIYSVTSPSSFESNAPFHPTPEGQEEIAEHVIPVVRQWFAQPDDPPASTPPAVDPPMTGPADDRVRSALRSARTAERPTRADATGRAARPA